MEPETSKAIQKLDRLPWPAKLILGALAVVGALTMVKWIVTIFAWLITLAMIIVVMVGLAFWVLTGRRSR